MDTLNVLVVWPYWLWTTKQSPARRFYVRAVMHRQDANLRISGPGFPDWVDDAPGIDNVRRLMENCDVVLGYKLAGTERGPTLREPQEVSKHFLTCEQFNEAWPGSTVEFGASMHPGGGSVVEECRKAETRLVIIHHANDLDRVKAVKEYGGKTVHIPHAASPEFFAANALPWERRSGVILTGSMNDQHYPLRKRWRGLIESGRIKGTIFHRCGNRVKSIQEADRLVEDYAKALGSAKVVLGCSSVWKYALARYPEVAMAGAVHVADMPDEAPVGYDKMIYRVEADWSDEMLINAVENALHAPVECSQMAHDTAMRLHATDHYAERFVNVVRGTLEAARCWL